MNEALHQALNTSGATPHEEAPSEASGWQHGWTAPAAALPEIACAFREAGYILELLTCQDRREDLQKMRLVYGFNAWTELDRHLIHADV